MKPEVKKNIQTLGKSSISHLWKDEIGDVFLLTKRMEIYAYSKTVLGCYCWHRKTYLQLQKMGVFFDVQETDDSVVSFSVKRANLPQLLALGGFKRRPHRNGKWIKRKSSCLDIE